MKCKSRGILALVFIVCALSVGQVLANEGPFGLTWGVSQEGVIKAGVQLMPMESQPGMEAYSTSNVPKDLSIAESYLLVFGEGYGLQKVIMISETIENDAFGTKGKEVYAGLKDALVAKYGEPSTNFEEVGLKLWDNSDEFYQCLAYSGCGMWTAIFVHEPSGQTIGLNLQGLRRGEGYIKLAYEGPKWSELIGQVKEKESKSDADAL